MRERERERERDRERKRQTERERICVTDNLQVHVLYRLQTKDFVNSVFHTKLFSKSSALSADINIVGKKTDLQTRIHVLFFL